MLNKAGSTRASVLHARQQLLMLGKVLRAPHASPLLKSTVVPGTLLPATSFNVRRQEGRPRKEWAPTVLQAAPAKNTTGRDLMALAQDVNAWNNCMQQ